MLVGLAVLTIAFFVLPTRVHERYLYPLIGVGAILAAVSYRWRIAYIAASVAMAANLYAILTWVELYRNPGIADWLGIRPLLAQLATRLEGIDPYDAAGVEQALRATAEQSGVKAAALIHATRVAVTGRAVSASLFDLLVLLGRSRVIQRLRRTVNYILPT